jgi:superoxide dismutase
MDSMRAFLTEENILIHKEYMRNLRLRHSIMEKSIPEIKGKTIFEIEKMRLPASIKDDILPNYKEYLAHELYFRSFSIDRRSPSSIRENYSSVESFLYEVYLTAANKTCGFVFVFVDEKGRPIIIHSDNIKRVKNVPRLAVDISEHAYFLDYRFEREKYLRSAIANLNLSLLDN